MPATERTDLLRRLKAAKRLPSPPGTALRVLELCRQDSPGIQEIAEAIMSDPALSGRLLKYANSSAMGAGRAVTSVKDAVLLLGLRTVKVTALGFSLASPDFQPRCPGFDLHRFWFESFLTAVISRKLATRFFKTDREEAFTAGLLARIGQLALAQGLREQYAEVLTEAAAGTPLLECERRRLGIDHAEFGAALLAEWQLPELLVDAVRLAQDPEAIQQPDASPLVRTVNLAVRLVPVFSEASPSSETQAAALAVVEQELQLDPDGWRELAQEIRTNYSETVRLYDMEIADQVDIFDLYAEAQEEISKVGMVAQLERSRVLEENRALLRKATTDALTGVANRAKFDERLEELTLALARGHGQFALLMFDIDHFKQFNDTYGHDVGDLVLKHVAQTVLASLRDVDLLARYGGEEFAILAPCTDRRGGCIIAARICKAVDNLRVQADGQELHVTISVGVAITMDYQAPPTAAQLVADADKQLYISKHSGRNTWSYLGRPAKALVPQAT